MRKVILLVLGFVLAFGSMSYAASIGTVQQVFDEETIATENTITSVAIPVKSSGYFGCWFKTSLPLGDLGLGKARIKMWIEESYDSTSANFTKPHEMDVLLEDFDTTTPTVITVSPTPMAYMRFKVEGIKGSTSAGNTTGTTITMYLFKQE